MLHEFVSCLDRDRQLPVPPSFHALLNDTKTLTLGARKRHRNAEAHKCMFMFFQPHWRWDLFSFVSFFLVFACARLPCRHEPVKTGESLFSGIDLRWPWFWFGAYPAHPTPFGIHCWGNRIQWLASSARLVVIYWNNIQSLASSRAVRVPCVRV